METGAGHRSNSRRRRAAELSEGSVSRAVQLADPALWDFREQLFRELVAIRESVRLARSVQAFVDEAGKEAAQNAIGCGS